MARTALRLDGLGKQYRIGRVRRRNPTLRDSLTAGARAVAGRMRSRLRGSRADPDRDDRIWALRDVSLEIMDGEAVGIVGGNGAGKSTLLKILSRITEPTTGYAAIYGRVGSLLEVGTGFHPELTGRENIFLNAAILGMPRREVGRKLDQIIDFAGVERFIDTPVKRFSSGMYLRLAFAVAAHLEPDILLVDEVLAVGDATFQRKCLGKMSDVTREGRTVLFVSHNMDAVRRLCSRTVLLDAGRVAVDADAATAITRYLLRSSPEHAPEQWIDVAHGPRVGSGEVTFLAARYSSRDPAVGCRPYPDGPLEFVLALAVDTARTIESVAISISDQGGTKLINADTVMHGESIRLGAGRNEITFRLQAVHLTPGTYVVGLWVADSVGAPFDAVEAAFPLTVVEREARTFGVTPLANGAVSCRFTVAQTG